MPEVERSRADIKDQATVFIAKWSLPAIIVMVVTMVLSAFFIDGESIGIISALVTGVVGGLVVVLQKMTGADREDPMSVVARELIDNLKRVEERNSNVSEQLIDNLKKSEERSASLAQGLIDHIRRPRSTELNVNDKSVSLTDGSTRAVVKNKAR